MPSCRLNIAPVAAIFTGSPLVLTARIVPVAAVLVLFGVWERALPVVLEVLVVALLGAAVLAAVHHAEILARGVGDLYGTLILAVAVTIIEVGLIITLMVSGGPVTAVLARDTVFAAVMITCNGIVGLSLLLSALRTRTADFNPEGTGAALATIITLATLSLVLPTFTTSVPGPEFSGPQLAFAAVASLVLYVLFVFVQNVRHRESFLDTPESGRHTTGDSSDPAAIPSTRAAMTSLGLLIAALVAVVGLAKVESKTIEKSVAAAGLPQSVAGVVIAILVLLPETLSAARNARRGRTQISLNLALGSGMASIGLTIPAIALASIWLEGPLLLGLGATQIALLALTAVVGTLTVIPGRATLLQAAVHLVLCVSYLFLAANP
jgi:Ca2+:H+ antiporter